MTRFLSSSSSEDLPKAHRDEKTGKWVTVYNEGEDGEFYKYEEWEARKEQVRLKHFQKKSVLLMLVT